MFLWKTFYTGGHVSLEDTLIKDMCHGKHVLWEMYYGLILRKDES